MIDYDQYPINVFFSDEDEGFIAIAPNLPGLSAFGKTAGDALNEIRAALPGWLDAMASVGNPIPEPSRYDPHQQYSGKVLLRMPRTLHGQLAERAKRENVSLNQCITYLLAAGVSTAPSKNDEVRSSVNTVTRIPHSGSTPSTFAETAARIMMAEAVGLSKSNDLAPHLDLDEGCGFVWLKKKVITTHNRKKLEGPEWQRQSNTALN
jgi:antitoxin HicB